MNAMMPLVSGLLLQSILVTGAAPALCSQCSSNQFGFGLRSSLNSGCGSSLSLTMTPRMKSILGNWQEVLALLQLLSELFSLCFITRPLYLNDRSEEHTSELQSLRHLVRRLLLEKKKRQALAHRLCADFDCSCRAYIMHTSA